MVKWPTAYQARTYETEVAVQDAIKALVTGNKNLLKSSLQAVSDQLESLSPEHEVWGVSYRHYHASKRK